MRITIIIAALLALSACGYRAEQIEPGGKYLTSEAAGEVNTFYRGAIYGAVFAKTLCPDGLEIGRTITGDATCDAERPIPAAGATRPLTGR